MDRIFEDAELIEREYPMGAQVFRLNGEESNLVHLAGSDVVPGIMNVGMRGRLAFENGTWSFQLRNFNV